MGITVEIEVEEAQMMMLALAELALSRPGWDWTLGELAEKYHGRKLFEQFKECNEDRVRETHLPLLPPFMHDSKLAKIEEHKPPRRFPKLERKIRV